MKPKPVLRSLIAAFAQVQTGRATLVIGNSANKASLLTNPVHDAIDIAATFKDADFDVLLRTDQALADFREVLKGNDTQPTSTTPATGSRKTARTSSIRSGGDQYAGPGQVAFGVPGRPAGSGQCLRGQDSPGFPGHMPRQPIPWRQPLAQAWPRGGSRACISGDLHRLHRPDRSHGR